MKAEWKNGVFSIAKKIPNEEVDEVLQVCVTEDISFAICSNVLEKLTQKMKLLYPKIILKNTEILNERTREERSSTLSNEV